MLRECGIEIRQETEHDFLSFCPYHGNRDTPAFSTSKQYGVSTCFNPGCGVAVPLERLIIDMKNITVPAARRLIMRKQGAGGKTFAERMEELDAKPDKFEEFPRSIIENNEAALWHPDNQFALDYLRYDRGFTEATIKKFNMGYSEQQGLITTPMMDPTGNFYIGVIGRSPTDENKVFKNSQNLPKSRTLWNIHNARRHESVIIVEANFDAASVDQAGYPNVVATLGGTLSLEQERMIKRHFNKVIIMTDNDPPQYNVVCRKCMRRGHNMCQGHQPGRELGMVIADKFSNMRVSWAAYDDNHIFARDVKDANKMTSDEITQCLRNAVPHSEYLEWQVN